MVRTAVLLHRRRPPVRSEPAAEAPVCAVSVWRGRYVVAALESTSARFRKSEEPVRKLAGRNSDELTRQRGRLPAMPTFVFVSPFVRPFTWQVVSYLAE